jgi:hypothetical protein
MTHEFFRGHNLASLRSASELASDKPHGTRIKYMGGCRCDHCRKANSAYECERQRARARGDRNGIIDAARARLHLKKLQRAGIGYKQVATITDVSATILLGIRQGKRKRLRERTERKILAVDLSCRADRAIISPGKTLAMISRLVDDEDYTKTRIARELGYRTHALQFNQRGITVKNAERVRRVYQKLTT